MLETERWFHPLPEGWCVAGVSRLAGEEMNPPLGRPSNAVTGNVTQRGASRFPSNGPGFSSVNQLVQIFLCSMEGPGGRSQTGPPQAPTPPLFRSRSGSSERRIVYSWWFARKKVTRNVTLEVPVENSRSQRSGVWVTSCPEPGAATVPPRSGLPPRPLVRPVPYVLGGPTPCVA